MPDVNEQPAGEEELLSLAREQRMNTEIRRAVFIALMGSEVHPFPLLSELTIGLCGCCYTDIVASS